MVAAALIGILSVARTARLIVHDTFPPVVHLRIWWDNHVTGGYNDLLHCQYCLAPWLGIGMLGWWYLAGGEHAHWTWWAINGWWGAVYLAASFVSWDQPEINVNIKKS